MKILLVEPYFGGSHQAWAEGYQRRSRHDVTLLSHGARFWKWRMHGAHITLAESARSLEARPDVVLASSMLNLPGFLGAARSSITAVPAVVYFHENQFSYPLSPLDRADDTYPMINWTSAAVADSVLFNSPYHRDTFFELAARFLLRFPDHRHDGLVAAVRARSEVVPVGVELTRVPAGSPKGDPPLILWNHRWEHDKGPDELAAMLRGLDGSGVAFRAAICGEQFVSPPAAFTALPGLLGDRLVHFGFAAASDYLGLLADASIVLSTAHQEFFGIAVVEAMAAGAVPVLPNRLVFPERAPDPRCLYEGDPTPVVTWLLEDPEARRSIGAAARTAVARFDWSVVAPRLDAHLETLV